MHVHVPAGAIPKDGPSAGVAMFTALASLFTDRVVRHDVAMTGEISLRGLVPPARHEKDLRDVPESIRATMKLVWLRSIDDAVLAALGEAGSRLRRPGFELA